MIDCSRCVRQKMKGSSSSQTKLRRNVYHNFRQYKYRHHNYAHCYSCSQSQLRRNINLQLRSHQMHKQTGGCLQDLQTLFDQLTFMNILYLSTNCKNDVLVRNLRSFATGCFFNWPPLEFAKCWAVSNRFRKTLESQTGPPMIEKSLNV